MDRLNLNVSPSDHCIGHTPIIFCRFERSPEVYGVHSRPYRSKTWIICCPRCQRYADGPDLFSALARWRDLR